MSIQYSVLGFELTTFRTRDQGSRPLFDILYLSLLSFVLLVCLIFFIFSVFAFVSLCTLLLFFVAQFLFIFCLFVSFALFDPFLFRRVFAFVSLLTQVDFFNIRYFSSLMYLLVFGGDQTLDVFAFEDNLSPLGLNWKNINRFE